MRTIESYTDSLLLSTPYFPTEKGGLPLQKSLYTEHGIPQVF
jgi:hypothetical protein